VPLVGEAVLQAFMDLLLPVTTVLTPNSLEARRLAPQAGTLDAAAQAILDRGAEMVLVTGAHEETPKVVNTLYRGAGAVDTFEWERLPSSYHGSGCTLAAAIAGLLAQGQEPVTAVREAQEYAWESLRHGYQISLGQHIPNRLFWARGRGAG
jgi:hydroxymethylpyrimidine/phosphomethylpyrimidine kinase